jgi:hypothetical protein
MNLTIIFCEGPHDAAFLSVILMKLLSFKEYMKSIKDLPFPLTNIKSNLSKKFSDEMILTDIRNQWFPEIYINNENLVAVYAIGSKDKYKTLESKDKKAVDLLEELFIDYRDEMEINKIKTKKDSDSEKDKFIDKINLGLFFDLDKDNQNDLRLDIIKAYKNYFPNINDIKSDSVIKGTENFGLYFFKKDVDDLIIELFKQYKDNIFDYIDRYLDDPPVMYGKDFNYKKAHISIAGQLQNSGSTNGTIIKRSGYINETNLNNSKECNNIAEFLSDLMEI